MPFNAKPDNGHIAGLITGLIDGIAATLKIKFGEKGLGVMPEIRRIRSPEKLKAIMGAVDSTASAEELRRIWAV